MNTTKKQRIKALKASIKHWKEDYPEHCDFEHGEFDFVECREH